MLLGEGLHQLLQQLVLRPQLLAPGPRLLLLLLLVCHHVEAGGPGPEPRHRRREPRPRGREGVGPRPRPVQDGAAPASEPAEPARARGSLGRGGLLGRGVHDLLEEVMVGGRGLARAGEASELRLHQAEAEPEVEEEHLSSSTPLPAPARVLESAAARVLESTVSLVLPPQPGLRATLGSFISATVKQFN